MGKTTSQYFVIDDLAVWITWWQVSLAEEPTCHCMNFTCCVQWGHQYFTSSSTLLSVIHSEECLVVKCRVCTHKYTSKGNDGWWWHMMLHPLGMLTDTMWYNMYINYAIRGLPSIHEVYPKSQSYSYGSICTMPQSDASDAQNPVEHSLSGRQPIPSLVLRCPGSTVQAICFPANVLIVPLVLMCLCCIHNVMTFPSFCLVGI